MATDDRAAFEAQGKKQWRDFDATRCAFTGEYVSHMTRSLYLGWKMRDEAPKMNEAVVHIVNQWPANYQFEV